MKLVVGLGNPGKNYARTRHNAGAQWVEYLAARFGIPLQRKTAQAMLGLGAIEGMSVVLTRPRTFMNESGEAVSWLLQRQGLTPQDLLVVYDDLDLPLGKLRLRPGGSAGGHRGVQSVIALLGTQEFARLRFGIGRPPPGVDEVTYVLGAFTSEEEAVMEEARLQAADALASLLRGDLQAAMSLLNR